MLETCVRAWKNQEKNIERKRSQATNDGTREETRTEKDAFLF